MKKYLLAISVVALVFTSNISKAQFISTQADDFEIWSADALSSSAMDPNAGFGVPGWQCLNILSSPLAGGSPISVFEENTIVHTGSHSCKITSVVLTPTSYANVKSFLPHDTVGIVAVGTISSAQIKLGVAHTQRITEAPKFWYQYMPQIGNSVPDTAFCTITLSHYSGGKRNILGAGLVKLNAASSWTLDSVPIFYDSLTGNPDTVQVFFSSSSLYAPVPGSILYIDGVSAVTGINNITAPTTSVNVYPNPANYIVHFNISGSNLANHIDVYDITGQKINTYETHNNLSTINTAPFAPGLYFYKLYDVSGSVIKMGKFTVTR